MYEKLPKSLKKLRPAKITSTQMIMLDTQAVISKHSMEQKGAGLRGDSYSRVYLTEYAMAKDPEKLKASALSAIGTTGQVIFEGTADHIGDGLYHEYLNAESTGYTTYFFPWTEHKDYTLPTTGEEVWDDEEKSLLQEGLSYQQLMFRRHWITRLGESKFLAEYPRTFDEAYQQTPGSYINKKYTDIIVVYKTRPDKVFYHEQPRAHHTYVIGLDTAMGAGKDYSSLHVLNARTLELVASFRSNSLYPTLFVDRAAEIASYYNKATINYERNGESGGIVGERLRSLKCNIMLYEDGQAWNTTSKSKRQLLETLRMSLIEQSISKLDDFTLQDLEDAQMDSTGKLIIDRSKQGSHFDGGMSLAFAVHAARNITLKPLPDWSRMYEVKSSTRKDLGRI